MCGHLCCCDVGCNPPPVRPADCDRAAMLTSNTSSATTATSQSSRPNPNWCWCAGPASHSRTLRAHWNFSPAHQERFSPARPPHDILRGSIHPGWAEDQLSCPPVPKHHSIANHPPVSMLPDPQHNPSHQELSLMHTRRGGEGGDKKEKKPWSP